MASSTMAPPPTPLAHRRTHRLIPKNLPPSPPTSPESSRCTLRKMSLSKGATFHCSSSPSTRDDPVLSIPHLTHRSPTFSQSLLTSWLSEKEDVAQSIADFEETFSGARGKRGAGRRRSLRDFEQQVLVRRAALPSDEGLGSSISPASDKGLAKTFERALDLLSSKDSGLGTSISDSVGKLGGNNSEEDGLVNDLIQEADSPDLTSRRLRQRPSAVTQSIAPQPSRTTLRHPPLNNSARNKLKEHILLPILRDDRFEEFHPFVSTLGSKTNKNIRCLRDLEKSLIFKPLTFAISRHLFRLFGEFTIQLVVDTYQHLSESEQRRAADRAYDNGYFLDLVQQVNRLATQIGSSSRAQQAGTAEEDDEMAYSVDDEVTLEGGLGETGNQAELVRWKNGKGISLRTGLPYVPAPGIKRHSSGELDEDVARSMARRKKGWVPDNVQMKCHDPGCDKTFTRKCDLAKHEKTHSRPFKCPEETCKYHDLGLPTEKERERHYNDKHSKSPHFYKCDFCEFRTKRESNCKQHQEKKHGWVYERAKGKDKAAAGSSKMTPAQTPRTPSMDYMPSPAFSSRIRDDASSVTGSIGGSYASSVAITPVEQPLNNFDTYQPAPVSYSNPLFPRATPSMPYNTVAEEFDFNSGPFQQPYSYHPAQAYISPTNTTPISSHNLMGTPITPAYSNITEPSDYATAMDLTMDCTNPTMWNEGLLTPGSFLQPQSRNPSISEYSPMITDPSTEVFHKASIMDQALGFPQGDFSLFGGESSNAFSNPAAASATLFPGGPEAFATLDNDPMFNENWTDEDLFDYDMGN